MLCFPQALHEDATWRAELIKGFEGEVPDVLLCVLSSDARRVVSRIGLMDELENLAEEMTQKEKKREEEETEAEKRKEPGPPSPFHDLIERK